MRRIVPLICILLLLPAFGLILSAPVVHASVALVQQNKNTAVHSGAFTLMVPFLSNVASGDVIVAVIFFGLPASISSVTDSLGTAFTSGPAIPIVGFEGALYYGTAPTTGPDTVNGIFTSTNGIIEGFVFEVSGVTASGAATGSGTGSTFNIATTSPVSFQSGAFLLGLTTWGCAIIGSCSFAPGAGFTLTTVSYLESIGQYSAGTVSSPSSFPATLSGGTSPLWGEVAIALNPTPPIPEYPLGLPILAVLTALAYAVIKRRTKITIQ